MKMGYFYASMVLCFIVLAGQIMSTVNAQRPQGYYKAVSAPQNPPAPDNSKANKDQTPNADQAGMSASDRDIAKRIRASIVADKSLSTYGHNVKVISLDGKVTLRGPVRSDDEKSNIASKAAAVIGDANVNNQLEVVPAKQ